jgi:membrane protease YdiL (CAAX protease family)
VVPLLVLLAAIALACVVGYFVVQGVGEFAPFRKIISKSTQLFLVLSIFPAMALLKMTKAELGFAPCAVFFKQLLQGLGLGLLTLLPIFILQYALDINVLDESRVWTAGLIARNMAITLGVALLISLIEEPLFRGILLMGLAKKMPVLAAIVVSATYYAALHFLNVKSLAAPPNLQWYSGFVLLQEAAGNLLNPEIRPAFCALLMVGVFLGVVRTHKPASLGLCIGCHTAWVWQIKMSKQLFNTDPHAEYAYLVSSYDGGIGPLVTAWLLLAVFGYWFYQYKRRVGWHIKYDGVIRLVTVRMLFVVLRFWFYLRKERHVERHTKPMESSPHRPMRTSPLFNGLSAVMAFLLWGSWAYYANVGTSASKGISAGFTQGTASFVITLVMVRLVSWIFRHLPRNFLQIPLAALLTVTLTGSCLVAIHLWAGTPYILDTITPALTVAFAFCCYTAVKLKNGQDIRHLS